MKTESTASLQSRISAFAEMGQRFEADRPTSLIAAHRVDARAWKRLVTAVHIYMSKCLPENQVILEADELLRQYERDRTRIKNITPNGMIVPKRHTILEYNMLVRSFVDMVDGLGIGEFISSWHIPLNVRIKFGEVDAENLKRHHPTEHIHSDSWAGESSESVTVHVPLFGDVKRNHVEFYEPPADFQESWLGPLPTYADGAAIAAKYKKIDFVPENGMLVLADFSTLHSSARLPGAGARVSIDTTFALKRSGADGQNEKIHAWRVEERASHEVLRGIGERHLFLLPDSVDRQVDSQGGFKHPTNLQLIKLLD